MTALPMLLLLIHADPPLPTADHLAGDWAISVADEKEPGAGAIRREGPCYGTDTQWTLTQEGTTVTAALRPGYFQGGAQRAIEIVNFDIAKGLLKDGTLHLEGTSGQKTVYSGGKSDPVVYQLTFDPKTGHLVGTRNGKSFWAVPIIHVPRTKACGPPPP
jgi:hypothetical protein